MYTAAVLDQVSSCLIKWMIRATLKLEDDGFRFKTEQGVILPHHMTVNLGGLDRRLNPNAQIGSTVRMEVSRLVFNRKLGICAIPVDRAEIESGKGWEPLKSSNACPHITCCLKPGVKPKTSNLLLEQEDPDTESLGNFEEGIYALNGILVEA